MSLYASANNGESNYERVPAGAQNAVCTAIAAVGPVLNQMYGNYSNKVWIKFEVPMEGEEEPREIWMQQTQSIGTKSTLGKMLRSWRGRDFTPEELQKFGLTNILGAPALIIVEERTAKNGNTYSNITSITKAQKVVKPSGETWAYDYEDPAQTNWDKLPKFIQSQIEAERQRQGQSAPVQQQANVKTEVEDPIDLSDIPF